MRILLYGTGPHARPALAGSSFCAFLVGLVILATVAFHSSSVRAAEPEAVLTGDCVPTTDGSPWDCRLVREDGWTFNRIEAECAGEVSQDVDREWFESQSYADTNEFFMRKMETLRLPAFSQWLACQGLLVQISSKELGIVYAIDVTLYDPKDQRLHAMTDNWPWWCTEYRYLTIVTSLFGCFVPRGAYGIQVRFAEDGEIKSAHFDGP